MIRIIELIVRTVLKLLLIAAGLVLAVVLSAFGLAVAVGFVAWQLLRGRRPEFRFKMNSRPEWSSARRQAPDAKDVVDVEVREIEDRK